MRKLKTLALAARPLLVASALLLLSTGFTECASFTDVTVPATDTTLPLTYDGVWLNGQYLTASMTGNSFEYHLSPGESVVAVSSGIDTGGLQSVEMYTGWSSRCCSGSVCSLAQPLSHAISDQQAGGVGSTVSNGIWVYSSVGLPTCGSGYTLSSFRFSWFTRARDFHGNTVVGDYQSIVYP
jgi:hypothetical protein